MEQVKQEIKKVAEKFRLSLVVLLGSRAQGRNRTDSDVDIAYLKDGGPLSFGDELKLAREMELLFKAPRADIISIPGASPLFMYLILQNGVVLFEKDAMVFPSLYTYSVKRYQDNLPLYQMRFEYLCKRYGVA